MSFTRQTYILYVSMGSRVTLHTLCVRGHGSSTSIDGKSNKMPGAAAGVRAGCLGVNVASHPGHRLNTGHHRETLGRLMDVSLECISTLKYFWSQSVGRQSSKELRLNSNKRAKSITHQTGKKQTKRNKRDHLQNDFENNPALTHNTQ